MATSHSGTSTRVEFRMPADLKAEVEEAAALTGVTFTSFATEVLIEKARQVKRDHSLSILNNEERDAFLKMLEAPPKPSPSLIRLMNARVEF